MALFTFSEILMNMNKFAYFAVTSTTLVLVACGGGGSGDPVAVTSTTINGSVVKGPVTGATVTVKNAATGAVLGTTTTAAGGSYTLAVPFSGDVIVEVSGGTYTDEATNANTPLSAPLKVVLAANGSNVTGVVTPLTTMAYTSAFGGGGAVTAAAFNTQAASVASQFKLNGINLATTTPVVTGSLNDYGKALAGVSQYLKLNSGTTLQSLVGTQFTATQLAAFAPKWNAAYAAAVPGSNVTFSFDGSAFNIGGTGVGGGTGTCGVNVQGTITSNGFTLPLNNNYCINGIAAGSCTSGNAALSQGISGLGGIAGAANLTYTYSATCAPGALTFNIS